MNTKPVRTKPAPDCPECGARMVLRQPKLGQRWDAFWSCSTWPDCHGKRSILSDGRPEGADDEFMGS